MGQAATGVADCVMGIFGLAFVSFRESGSTFELETYDGGTSL
jgi:hypothetical protein